MISLSDKIFMIEFLYGGEIMERIKQVWPKWKGLEILGEGGFGIVYKAKKDSFAGEELSAIKIVKIPHNQSEHDEMMSSGFSNENIKEYYQKSVMNLVDEIKLMQRMKAASHVVTIEDYEVVENDNGVGYTIFIRMELLTNITKYFRERQIKSDDVIKMAIHILTALEFCHDQNIMHRDIKPANIFISEFGEYKLGDFGVSREVERTNATMSQKGTKSYMAPEMVRMERYGKNVDLYALGLTMYELLNHGRMPFLPPFPQMFNPMDREEANYKRLRGEEFPDIEGIGELNAIIKKACHPDKQQRYQSAKEMKNDLLKLNHKDSIVEENKVEFDEEKTTCLFDDDLFSQKETDISNDKTLNVFNENTFLFKDDKTIALENKKTETQKVELKKEEMVLKTQTVDQNKCPVCGSEMEMLLDGIRECTQCDCLILEKNDSRTKSLFNDYQDTIKYSKEYDMRIFAFNWLRRMYHYCSKEELIKVQHKRNLASYAFNDVLNLKREQKSLAPHSFEELYIYERDKEYDGLQSQMQREFHVKSSEKILMILTAMNTSKSNVIFSDKGIYFKGNGHIFYVPHFQLGALDVKRGMFGGYTVIYNNEKIKVELTGHELFIWYSIMNNMKEIFHSK